MFIKLENNQLSYYLFVLYIFESLSIFICIKMFWLIVHKKNDDWLQENKTYVNSLQ